MELGIAQQGVQAIVKGLDAQDQVIVNGVQNASPGNKVEIHQPKNATVSQGHIELKREIALISERSFKQLSRLTDGVKRAVFN